MAEGLRYRDTTTKRFSPQPDPKLEAAAKQQGLRARASAAAAGAGRYRVFPEGTFPTLKGGMGATPTAAPTAGGVGASPPSSPAVPAAGAADDAAKQGLRRTAGNIAKTGGNWLSKAGNAVRQGAAGVAGVTIPIAGASSALEHAADPKKAYEKAGALGIDPQRDSLLGHSAAHTWNSTVAEGRDVLRAVGDLFTGGALSRPEAAEAESAQMDPAAQIAGRGPAVADAPGNLSKNVITQTPAGATIRQPDGGFAELTSEDPNLREKVSLRMGGTGRSADGTISVVPTYTQEQLARDLEASQGLRAARIGITPEQLAVREGRAEGEDTRFATIGQSGGHGILDNRYEALRRAKMETRANDPHLSPRQRAQATEAMKTNYSAQLDAMGQLSPEERVALLRGGKGGKGGKGAGGMDFSDQLNLLKFQADQAYRAEDLGLRRGEAQDRRSERLDKRGAEHDKRFYEAIDRAAVNPETGEIDQRKRAELSKRLAGIMPGTAEFEDALQQSAATNAGMTRWKAESGLIGDNLFNFLDPFESSPAGPTTLSDMQKELYTLATTMDDKGRGKYMGKTIDTTNMPAEIQKWLRQTRKAIGHDEQKPSMRRE